MYNTSPWKGGVLYMNKDKRKALELLKKKVNGEIKITYREIAKQSGYERKQINRFISELEKEILILF